MLTKFPHPVPVEQSTYCSEYDSIYQRKHFGNDLPRPHTSVTGFLKNAPQFYPALPFGRHHSTSHDAFVIRPDTSVQTHRKQPTAHVRNQSTFGPRGPPERMISTTQDAYQKPEDLGGFGVPFRYAGDAAIRYNRDFLRVDGPDDTKLPKDRPKSPPTKWRTRRDGTLRVNPHDRLEVYSPPRFKTIVSHPNIAEGGTDLTGAARMGGQRSEVGSAGPFEGTTTYRRFMVNQWKLPEPIDPTRRRKRRSNLIRLNQHEVSFAAAEALAQIRGDNGRLVERKPDLVHPTIWRLELQQERSVI